MGAVPKNPLTTFRLPHRHDDRRVQENFDEIQNGMRRGLIIEGTNKTGQLVRFVIQYDADKEALVFYRDGAVETSAEFT